MKKITGKQKQAQVKYGRRRFIRSLNRKNKKKKSIEVLLSKKVKARRGDKFRNVEAPKNYSFIENTEEFITYLNKAKTIAQEGYGVNMNLSDISSLTFDSLCLLMATTKNKKIFGKVKGTIPLDPHLRNIFEQSGFVNRLEHASANGNLGGEMYSWVSNKSYSRELSQKCTELIVEYTYLGDRISAPQTHPVFVEMMTNTEQHAGEGYNWRLFYYKDEDNITKICFIDLGQGILGSLNSNIEQLKSEIGNLINLETLSNIDKLRGLLNNTITLPKKRTKTQEKKRGTGLPRIFEFMKEEKVKNSYVITNDVKCKIRESEDEYEMLKNKFKGTFYYRELHP